MCISLNKDNVIEIVIDTKCLSRNSIFHKGILCVNNC